MGLSQREFRLVVLGAGILFPSKTTSRSQNTKIIPVSLRPNKYWFTPRSLILSHLSLHHIGGVGKSSLTAQFVQGLFIEGYDPTVEDSHRKQVEIDQEHYILEILDTAGTEQFTALRELYIKSGEGFLLVFSLTSSSTLEEISILRDQILRIKNARDIPIVVCANKADLESDRAVSQHHLAHMAKCWGTDVPIFETSAKRRFNVEDVFMTLARLVIRSDEVLNAEGQQGTNDLGNERKFDLKQCRAKCLGTCGKCVIL